MAFDAFALRDKIHYGSNIIYAGNVRLFLLPPQLTLLTQDQRHPEGMEQPIESVWLDILVPMNRKETE